MRPSSCSQCPSHIAIVQNARRNALELVARKHVNRCEQRAADPDRTREFGLYSRRDSSLLSRINSLLRRN
jgi:hypothetical protein